jgi:hypothetical protein
MGLLRDILTKHGKVAYLPNALLGSDEPDLDWGLEQERIDFEAQRLQSMEEKMREQKLALKKQALSELATRLSAPKRRGRPATLNVYKTYQRNFLKKWSRTVYMHARKAGVTQSQLATIFGFQEDSEWRALMRGAPKACYKMSHSKWTVPGGADGKTPGQIAWSMGWRSNLVVIKDLRYMTEMEFLHSLGIDTFPTKKPQNFKVISVQ